MKGRWAFTLAEARRTRYRRGGHVAFVMYEGGGEDLTEGGRKGLYISSILPSTRGRRSVSIIQLFTGISGAPSGREN
jgi:hypothetical protein